MRPWKRRQSGLHQMILSKARECSMVDEHMHAVQLLAVSEGFGVHGLFCVQFGNCAPCRICGRQVLGLALV